MSVVSISDFVGAVNIPQTGQPAVQDELQLCIDAYEIEYLRAVLGIPLTSDFISGLAEDPIPAKWLELRDGATFTGYDDRTSQFAGIKYCILRYVHYHWQTWQASKLTGVGETATKTENSVRISPAARQSRLWNEMVAENWVLVKFLAENNMAYPNWEKPVISHGAWAGCRYGNYTTVYNDLFRTVNEFNI